MFIMKRILLYKKRMISLCLIFSLLIVLGYGIKIYGASSSAYVHGLVNLMANNENGALAFRTDGFKLDQDYISENTVALNNGDTTFELFLITDIKYKNSWIKAKKYNSAKLIGQRTFTKNSSDNYERKNDLSGTYTVTNTAAMKKILEWKSSPALSANISSHSDGKTFSINFADEYNPASWDFHFNYYYFYTLNGGYVIGNNSLSLDYNVMYSVNGGAWKKNTSSASGKVFNISDFNPGDIVKIKLMDELGLGYESNTVTVKIGAIIFKAGDSGVKSVSWNGTEYSLAGGASQTYTGVTGAVMESAFKFNNGYSMGYTEVSDNATDTWSNNPETWTVLENTRTVIIHSKSDKSTLTINPNGGKMWNGSNYTTLSFTTSYIHGRKTYIGNLSADGTYKSSNIPTREGYTFTGWSFSSGTGGINTSGNKYYFSDTSKYASAVNTYIFNGDCKGNVTATAQWEKNSYTMTINPNGGKMRNGSNYTTSPFTTEFVYGRKTYIGNLTTEGTYYSLNAPTREGYTFTGWSFSGGTGGINTSGNKYYFSSTSGTASDTDTYIFNGDYKGDITATAQWKDNTPPEWITKNTSGKKVTGGLYITPPSWTNGSAVIKAEATDTGSGMSSVKIYGSNKELATGVSSASYTQSTEGIIYYYAVATDKAGNKATTSIKAAYVDKTPPVITAGVSSSGWTNKDIRLTATATDALSGVQKVEIFTASGKSVASGKTGAAYTITEPTNEEYIIRATDAAGNTAEKKQSVQLDKENSDVIIDDGTDTPTEFKPGAATESHVIGWVNKDVPIKVTATDVLSGIKTIELKDHYGTVIKSDPSELQYTFTNEGISHYTITVTDNAGNIKTINLTVKIDKTPPLITGEEEIKDPNYGLIEHQATDSISGIKSFKLYYYDTMEEVTEEDGLVYKENNIISFKSMNTYNLYWKLIAEDNAGNITEMTVHTPYNFKIKAEADNLRTETENFLIGADAQLKITLWGYIDTVEVKFERTLEDAAEKEEYTLNRLIESGDAFVRIPEKNDYVEYTFKLPEGVDPREYRIWVNGYRDGWKRTEHLDINLITYDQLCKEQVHKFKRVIKSPTWRKVDEYTIK